MKLDKIEIIPITLGIMFLVGGILLIPYMSIHAVIAELVGGSIACSIILFVLTWNYRRNRHKYL